MSIFEEGSPFIRFLNRMADLLIINLLTLLMCVPVITAGASLTAMHYVLLKLVRDEEGYIVRSFFRSFKLNFLQATAMWLIAVALYALMGSSLSMIIQNSGSYPIWLPSAILVTAILLWTVMIYAFALLSRYDNSVFRTLFNAVSLTFGELLRSLEMLIITIAPLALLLRTTFALPFLLLFGLSVPGYACAMIYDPVFRKIERQMGLDEERVEEHEE